MLNKIVTILLLSLFVIGGGFSQESVMKKKPLLLNDNSITSNQHVKVPGTGTPLTAANFVAVDTMANTYGPASPTINPIAYDPISNVLSFVHRGYSSYALGSGELWWNYSTDMGASWVRSSTSVQNGSTSQILARYPSMSLSNSAHSTDLADVWGVFSWPELISSFGYLGYGVAPGMQESAFAEINLGPPTYGSNTQIWASDNYIFWASDNQDDASIRLFRTTDYSVIETIDPPQWNDTVFNSNGNIAMGGVDMDNVEYYGVLGDFRLTNSPNGWEPGYSKSTDNGATWSNYSIADWFNIPVTADFDELWDYKLGDAFISYAGGISVDSSGYVHMVTGMTDTLSGRNAIVEFFETSEGVWDAKIVADSIPNTAWYYPENPSNYLDPAIGQMGYTPNIATNEAKDFFVCQWVQASPTAGDTLCDIYMKYRKLDGEWSGAINLTETDEMNEDGSHLAPQLAVVEDANVRSYYAFSMYWYEAGNTSPETNDVNPSVVYVAKVLVYSEDITGVDDNSSLVNSYKLNQNYPNPFNPTTSISFTLPERSFVTLKVYDVLGKEVATIVNGVKDAGTNVVNFNASNLASGVYIYKLTSGNFTESKKMMIMK